MEGCTAALAWIRNSERGRREGQCSRTVEGSILLDSRAAEGEGAGSCRRGMEAAIVPEEAEENMIVVAAAEEGGSSRASLADGVSDGFMDCDDGAAGTYRSSFPAVPPSCRRDPACLDLQQGLF